jgi:hypothetical protein
MSLRLAAIPGELRTHDFAIKVLNEDIELWVADTYRDLEQELRGISNRQGPHIEDGSHLNARAGAKTRALHRWRDRLHAAERELVDLQGQENWLHGLARHLYGSAGELHLAAIERIEPVIDELRRDVETPAGQSTEVRDPSRFSLDELLEEIDRAPLV